MTDIDELYITAINGLSASLNRVADALETHLPAIAAGPVPPVVEPPVPPVVEPPVPPVPPVVEPPANG